MFPITRFIILVESRWLRAAAIALALTLATLLSGLRPAYAGPSHGSKIAADLREAMSDRGASRQRWSRDVAGQRYVKALIVSSSTDPELADLRAQVLAVGGSVYYRYLSVQALSVMLPADRVDEIARRADVQSISPNRVVTRTASALELATGAHDARGAGGALQRLDGSGIGIAVLDSGLAWNHLGFRAADGRSSRVARAVDFERAGDVTAARLWRPGIDASAALNDRAASMLERLIAADR
ncbi:MAG TPA: hypothetical protein VGP22_17110, partial [Albitalea sp.]|nr:hypothetical protein [Albitalea sp.]